jgi:hypothetical protein
MKKLLNFIIFSSISTILFGCGGGNSKSGTSFRLDASVSAQRSIDTNERNIATRICYAYQSKSQNFRLPNYLNTKFNFEVKETDCRGSSTRMSVTSILKLDSLSSILYFSQEKYTGANFMKNVQTDVNGYLSSVCTKIRNGQDISNTVEAGAIKIQISFFKEKLDGFYLQYFVRVTANEYKIQSAEKFLVRTQVDMAPDKVLGMDEYYSSQRACASNDPQKFSNFEQTFTSR